jgi:hypothetical protein
MASELKDIVNDLFVDHVSPRMAGQLVIDWHYLRRRTAYTSYAYGLWRHCFLVGVAIFGPPVARQLQTSMYPENPDQVLELSRVWVSDEMPKNTVSWFVSRCLKKLPPLYHSFVQRHERNPQGSSSRRLYLSRSELFLRWIDKSRDEDNDNQRSTFPP